MQVGPFVRQRAPAQQPPPPPLRPLISAAQPPRPSDCPTQVANALRSQGLTLQNYASIKEQTVGGFTQVGAHGTGAAIPPVDEQASGGGRAAGRLGGGQLGGREDCAAASLEPVNCPSSPAVRGKLALRKAPRLAGERRGQQRRRTACTQRAQCGCCSCGAQVVGLRLITPAEGPLDLSKARRCFRPTATRSYRSFNF